MPLGREPTTRTFVSFFPKEGVVGWMDNLAIPRDAKDPENARLFLEFMLKPENSALSANFTRYDTAITGSAADFDQSLRDAPELNVPTDTKIVFTPTCPVRSDQIDRSRVDPSAPLKPPAQSRSDAIIVTLPLQ